MDKEGRPPARIAAWRSLHARDAMERRYPAVVALIDMLALENVDVAVVTAAVEQAKAQLHEGRHRHRGELSANVTLDERRLHTAEEIERLAEDQRALSDVKAVIDAELATVQAELDAAEARLLRQSLEREPVDGYVHAVRPKLAAAGLNALVARTLNADRINAIRDALAGQPPAKPKPSRPVIRRRAEDALAWTPDNPWAEFLTTVKDYDFRPQPRGGGGIDVASLRRCGLPPHLDLGAFGYPYLMGAVGSAKEPAAMEKACWHVCREWLNDNIAGSMEPSIEAMRQRAWSFLFGLDHGYAGKLERYRRVNLPSPWKKDEQIIATRRS